MNAGASLSVRQDKVNFNVAGFGNQMKNWSAGETHLVDLLANPNLLVDQYSQGRMNGGFIFGKAGLDYFATDRSTFSFSLIKVRGEMSPTEMMRSDSSLSDGTYLSYSERTSNTERIFNATGVQFGYKYLFPRKGEELTADVNTFQGRSETGQYYDTYVYDAKGGSYYGEQHQQILGEGTNRFTTIQTDYVRPLNNNKGKIEAGLRAQLRSLTNTQSNYFQTSGGEFIKIPNASSNYENYDNVYAAYLSYKGSVKNFGYQVGLRAESSDYKGTITDTQEEFSNRYPLSLFPSVFLSQKLKNSQELQMSYTRRVNRPFFLQLMPFIDSSNQAFWTQGNPSLKPEFTNSLEASYSKTYKGKNNFLASIYYKHTTGLITTILDTVTVGNGNTHPVTTYINANSSYMAGLELTSQNYFTKWWDMNTNVNIYNSKIDASSAGINNEALWSWFAKFNSNFKLPKNYTIQVSGTYQSRTNQPVSTGGGFGPPGMNMSQSSAQGYVKANYGFDLAVKKSFLKNNAASLTISATDIFQTRWTHSYTYAEFYERESVRWPDSPMFRATFNYRFGKMDMNLFKRKNMKAEGESMQGLQM
jgi:outer membrane receptor protein involved in Fe transport